MKSYKIIKYILIIHLIPKVILASFIPGGANQEEAHKERERFETLLMAKAEFEKKSGLKSTLENARDILSDIKNPNNIYLISSAVEILAYSNKEIDASDKLRIFDCAQNLEKNGIVDAGFILYTCANALTPDYNSIILYNKILNDNENSLDWRVFSLLKLMELGEQLSYDPLLIAYSMALNDELGERILHLLQQQKNNQMIDYYNKSKTDINRIKNIKKNIICVEVANNKSFNLSARLKAALFLNDNSEMAYINPKILAQGVLSKEQEDREFADKIISRIKQSKDMEIKNKLSVIVDILNKQNASPELVKSLLE